jgi:hypothetical protein
MNTTVDNAVALVVLTLDIRPHVTIKFFAD